MNRDRERFEMTKAALSGLCACAWCTPDGRDETADMLGERAVAVADAALYYFRGPQWPHRPKAIRPMIGRDIGL